jgi:hypothetical protein
MITTDRMVTDMMMTALILEHEETDKRMAEIDAEMAEVARQLDKIEAERAKFDGLFN